MIASVPSMAICDFESFRSKRVLTSFVACWMALATSARSILLTISKLLSGMDCHRHKLRQPSGNSMITLRDGCSKTESRTDQSPQTCTHEGNRRGIICEGERSDLHGQSHLFCHHESL